MATIAEFPGPLDGVVVMSLVGDGCRVPQFDAAFKAWGNRCETEGKKQGLSGAQMRRLDMYAVLGTTENGVVVGLQRQEDRWRLVQVPLPSTLIKALGIKRWAEGMQMPLWVWCAEHEIAVLRQGSEKRVWQSSARWAKAKQPHNPLPSSPPSPSIG